MAIYRRVYGLVIGFIDHLQMVTSSNYNAIANSCIRLTAAHTKFSHFLTSRFLVTNPTNVFCLRPYWLANVPRLTYCSNFPCL
jgi:hypothetical protein